MTHIPSPPSRVCARIPAMRDRPSVAAGVHPVPGTRVFIEHPGSDPQLVVFTTWDDMAPSCSEQISDEQRATVHRLQRQGFGISYAWPDFDHPDQCLLPQQAHLARQAGIG